MKNAELVLLLEKLSRESHAILFKVQEANQPSDSIIKSISITLDKALYNSTNNLPITNDVINGISNACVIAVRLFEGSGLENDLEEVRALLYNYDSHWVQFKLSLD